MIAGRCASICGQVRLMYYFFFSSRRRHTRCLSDWSSDVCSSDLVLVIGVVALLSGLVKRFPKHGKFLGHTRFAAYFMITMFPRSEERRVGKECRFRCARAE